MSLLQEHQEAAQALASNTDVFGSSVVFVDTSGNRFPISCNVQDISATIDPETQQIVTGRLVSFIVGRAAIESAGMGLPRAIAQDGVSPWLVEYADQVWRVNDVRPDRVFGMLIVFVEAQDA